MKRKLRICSVAYLISISSYSLLYSGIVAFLWEEKGIWLRYQYQRLTTWSLPRRQIRSTFWPDRKTRHLFRCNSLNWRLQPKCISANVLIQIFWTSFFSWYSVTEIYFHALSPMNAGLASALKSSIFFSGSVIVSQLGIRSAEI